MTTELSLPPAYRLVVLDTVDSTNEEAKRLAALGEAEAEDGTLVWARQQTAGRGRLGRQWFSPEGNLSCSLIARPEVPAKEAVQLGFVAALAIYDAISRIAKPGQQIHCKWPNDVLLENKKVAGILLESEAAGDAVPAWIVLGVGINIAHHPSDTDFPATSLSAEGCRGVSVIDVLEAFGRHFLTWTNRWLNDGFPPIREHWLHRAMGLGEDIQVRLEDRTLSGRFSSLDEDGVLILETPDGTSQRITAGDVFFPGS
jgi:BirA family biotin operon repressor/biotin-[acetyl-CoA-carboxylase] ligase